MSRKKNRSSDFIKHRYSLPSLQNKNVCCPPCYLQGLLDTRCTWGNYMKATFCIHNLLRIPPRHLAISLDVLGFLPTRAGAPKSFATFHTVTKFCNNLRKPRTDYSLAVARIITGIMLLITGSIYFRNFKRIRIPNVYQNLIKLLIQSLISNHSIHTFNHRRQSTSVKCWYTYIF